MAVTIFIMRHDTDEAGHGVAVSGSLKKRVIHEGHEEARRKGGEALSGGNASSTSPLPIRLIHFASSISSLPFRIFYSARRVFTPGEMEEAKWKRRNGRGEMEEAKW